jgi:POT family proton-dependent oligopeptide transporter
MATNPETIAAVPPGVVPGEGQTTKEISPSAHPVYRSDEYDDEIEGEFPTEEEFQTLRRVPDKIPWIIYTVAFIELCERFSYYGTTVVCKLSSESPLLAILLTLSVTNFIQQPLPEGSRTGAGFKDGQSGALDKGQRTSTGLTTFNQFWVYLIPLFGAYVADAHLGRYKTIAIALGIAIFGHIILVISAIPPVITKPSTSMGVFIVGLIIMGVGTGAFKPNISPLIAEQLPLSKMVVRELPSGERVIVDPAVTQSRVYSYFYLFINIGALVGQIGMVYCEKYVGFWLAFLLPTVLLCFCPFVLLYGRNKYKQQPPNGSVFSKAMRLFLLAQKGKWSINPVSTYKRMNDGLFWEDVKPSHLATARPHWMTFDDKWVDEVKRGFAACTVFCWFPIYCK